MLRGVPQLRWPPPRSILEGQGILPQLLNCKCVNIPPVPVPRLESETEPTAEASENGGEGEGGGEGDGEREREGEGERRPAARREVFDEGEGRPRFTPRCTPLRSPYLLACLSVCLSVCVSMCPSPSPSILSLSRAVSGQCEYDPPAGTILPPGEHTLTVLYRPPRSQRHLWEDGTAQTRIEVRTRPKATPAITWAVPEEPLPYPVRLDDELLGAKAAVSGRFSFSPPWDTLLDVGRYAHAPAPAPAPAPIDETSPLLSCRIAVTASRRSSSRWTARTTWRRSCLGASPSSRAPR